jgi:hypothetical protein
MVSNLSPPPPPTLFAHASPSAASRCYRWLRGPSDLFCGKLLDDLHKDLPIKIKVFYTRPEQKLAGNATTGDNSHASVIASSAGR